METAAQEECASYLSSKYNIAAEFTDTDVYNHSTIYGAQSRVELNFPAYVAANTYNTGDLVSVGTNQYIAKALLITGAFDASKFTLIGTIYDLWYLPYPKPLFDIYGKYLKNDEVWYKGKTYTARQPSGSLTHEDYLNAGTVDNIPLNNVFPDDPTQGANVWGSGTAYTVTAKAPNTSTTDDPPVPAPWVKGDNRSQQMVMVMIDVTLFHLHSRIAPQNIPELRLLRYNAAKDWLDAANTGNITPQLLKLIQPLRGTRIRFGGNTKVKNVY